MTTSCLPIKLTIKCFILTKAVEVHVITKTDDIICNFHPVKKVISIKLHIVSDFNKQSIYEITNTTRKHLQIQVNIMSKKILMQNESWKKTNF